MKFYHDDNMFFEPLLLTINSTNQAVFLNDDGISLSDGTKRLLFDETFKALIALKTKPLFYMIWLDHSILKVKKYNTDLEEQDSQCYCFNGEMHLVDIKNVYFDSLEKNLYLVVLTEKNISLEVKITEELKCTTMKRMKEDDEAAHIETISFQNANQLLTTQRPGVGLSAVIVGSEKKWHLDKYHCHYGEYVVFSIEKEHSEKVVVMNLSTFHIDLKFEFENPIISAKMLDNNRLICLLNKAGHIEMAVLNILSNKIEKIYSFDTNIELHVQVFDKIMIKKTSLSDGVSWGYINTDLQIEFPASTVNSVDFVNAAYFQHPVLCILFEPRQKEIQKIIISIHGGPESFEFDEFRFNGIYREFVYRGVLVCALNYKGSAYRSLKTRKSAWKNWRNVVKEILECSQFLEKKYGISRNKITLLGVSFGAALGLLAGKMSNENFEKIIAIAPLMNLKSHLNKLDAKELRWFKTRFNRFEINVMFHYKFFQKDHDNAVYLIQGDNDSVLDYNETLLAYKTARIKNLNWNLFTETDGDHVPTDLNQKKRRYRLIYQSYFDE